jgi:hypothetical protein
LLDQSRPGQPLKKSKLRASTALARSVRGQASGKRFARFWSSERLADASLGLFVKFFPLLNFGRTVDSRGRERYAA